MDYSVIKENPNKILQIKKGSIDTWKLGEIMHILGYDEKASNFNSSHVGLDVRVDNGYITFRNGTRVEVV